MQGDQRDLVAKSLIGVPRDTYRSRSRPPADLDIVSIELALISAMTRAVGMASIEDNTHPAYTALIVDVDSALASIKELKVVRSC